MGTWKYTRQEKMAIERAWNAAVHIAERDHTAERMLWDALSAERRERSSIHVAKALIIQSIANRRPEITRVSSLFGMARGIQLAYIIGADWRARRMPLFRKALPLFKAAQEAHDAYIARGCDRVVSENRNEQIGAAVSEVFA